MTDTDPISPYAAARERHQRLRDRFPGSYGSIPAVYADVALEAWSANKHRTQNTGRAPEAAPTVGECLDALSFTHDVREQLDRNERELIEEARRLGASWEQIAEVLGYHGKTGAQRRWRSLAGRYATPPEPLPHGDASG